MVFELLGKGFDAVVRWESKLLDEKLRACDQKVVKPKGLFMFETMEVIQKEVGRTRLRDGFGVHAAVKPS